MVVAALGAVLSAPAVVPGAEGAPRQEAARFVIVALGDSYAAGEGAPEVPGNFAFDAASSAWTGTPEVWTVGGGDAARRCHRSPLSGFGQAAAELEGAFEPAGVEIVFRSVACAGAGIRFPVNPAAGTLDTPPAGGGLLGNYSGVPGEPGTPTAFAPQVAQVRQFLVAEGEQADAVLMNVGGNDLGFGRLIFLCAVEEYIRDYATPATIDGCQESSATTSVIQNVASPTTVPGFLARLTEGTLRRCAFVNPLSVVTGRCVPTLRASYDLLGSALRGVTRRTYMRCNALQEARAETVAAADLIGPVPVGTTRTVYGITCTKRAANSIASPVGVWTRTDRVYTRLNAGGTVGGIRTSGRVYITTVPDPLENERGEICNREPIDDLASQKVIESEAVFLRQTVRPLLNGQIVGAASRQGWTVIPVASAATHGICALPREQRWFNTNRDALSTQGADVLPATQFRAEPAISGGFVHPNAAGYQGLYVTPVAQTLRAQICAQFRLQPCPQVG